MPTPESGLEALANRVAKLEAQNRRLKKMAIAALLVVAAFITMGQAPTQKVVEANKFELKDSDGKTRALLETVEGNAELLLYGPQGSKQHGFISGIGSGPNGPFVSFTDANGKDRMDLNLQPGDTPALILRDANDSPNVRLSGGETPMLHLGREGGKEHFLAVVAPGLGPYQSLSDAEGFQTAIGSTDLLTPRTGETHKTSAASVVLFGKDNKVLWSAP